MGLKSQVREQAMVTQGDTKTGESHHHAKERDLEPAQPEMPDIERHGGQREQEGADEENTGFPVDFFKGDSIKHTIRCGMKGLGAIVPDGAGNGE